MKIKESTYRLVMMVGLYIGLALFVLAIIALAKNVEEIKKDPIIYGMEKHDFISCMCYDLLGNIININLNEIELNITGESG